MNQERIVQVFFFGFLALITWELYQVFEPFLMPIAWAILLAFLAHPALIELDRGVRSRTTSALVITIIVALGVVLPAVWLSERLLSEAQTLYGAISGLSTKGGLDRIGALLRDTTMGARLDDLLARHGIRLDDEIKRSSCNRRKSPATMSSPTAARRPAMSRASCSISVSPY